MKRSPAAAGVLRRTLAAVIDLGVVVATLYALQAAVALSVVGTWPGSLMRGSDQTVREGAVSLVVAVAYSAECWSRSGRTAGGAALGVRVVARDGLPLRPAEAIMRAAACLIFPVGLFSAAVDRQRRSLQDMAFGSRVICERPRPSMAQPVG
ncbi:RDD family protein [Mycobacterium sp.]|uniref:RDD family protein n=1 Tax=Mycobacterium sp. TaxID=1785 RepID=UPI002CECB035|nr:RDD family protein [Mycobacterium sp.]HME49363.1 RDD family protein [Mycobacterium sp.]